MSRTPLAYACDETAVAGISLTPAPDRRRGRARKAVVAAAVSASAVLGPMLLLPPNASASQSPCTATSAATSGGGCNVGRGSTGATAQIKGTGAGSGNQVTASAYRGSTSLGVVHNGDTGTQVPTTESRPLLTITARQYLT
jgi:hypothetical protein